MKKLLIACFLFAATLQVKAAYEDVYGVSTPTLEKSGPVETLTIFDERKDNLYSKMTITGVFPKGVSIDSLFNDASAHYLNVESFEIENHDFYGNTEVITTVSQRHGVRVYLIKGSDQVVSIILKGDSLGVKNFLLYLKANKFIDASLGSVIDLDLGADAFDREMKNFEQIMSSEFGGI